MPNAFFDEKLLEALNNIESKKEDKQSYFPAHSFVANALKIGFTFRDLEKKTFVFIMKVLFSYLNVDANKKDSFREATQQDIDRFMR